MIKSWSNDSILHLLYIEFNTWLNSNINNDRIDLAKSWKLLKVVEQGITLNLREMLWVAQTGKV